MHEALPSFPLYAFTSACLGAGYNFVVSGAAGDAAVDRAAFGAYRGALSFVTGPTVQLHWNAGEQETLGCLIIIPQLISVLWNGLRTTASRPLLLEFETISDVREATYFSLFCYYARPLSILPYQCKEKLIEPLELRPPESTRLLLFFLPRMSLKRAMLAKKCSLWSCNSSALRYGTPTRSVYLF
jgi:hypothetical protein